MGEAIVRFVDIGEIVDHIVLFIPSFPNFLDWLLMYIVLITDA